MSIEAMVVRAMLRLARRREAAGEEALAARVAAPPALVRAALRRLEAAGLVEQRVRREPRLTMAGLAVAVGSLPAPAVRTPRRGRALRRGSRAA